MHGAKKTWTGAHIAARQSASKLFSRGWERKGGREGGKADNIAPIATVYVLRQPPKCRMMW